MIETKLERGGNREHLAGDCCTGRSALSYVEDGAW
jgi:hypothetical protein